MSLLNSLKVSESSSSSSSISESIEVKVASLSAPISGKFGLFRSIKIADKVYSVDDKRVSNSAMFTPNCLAVLTVNQYKGKDGVEKTIISSLAIAIPQACGYFIAR